MSTEKNIYLIEVTVRDPQSDAAARAALHDLQEYGLREATAVRMVRLFSVCGAFDKAVAERVAAELLTDPVVEMFAINRSVFPGHGAQDHVVEVAKRAGVMEPSEQSILRGMRELGVDAEWVRIGRRYIISGSLTPAEIQTAVSRTLANPVIEQVSVGQPLDLTRESANALRHDRTEVPIAGMTDAQLEELSLKGQLYMSLDEMKAAQAYFEKQGRAPTDIELETIAQTWSEHCCHKTFRGKIRYVENGGQPEEIDNLLKNTIARATHELTPDWCWSVFEDNSGVIDFNGEYGIAFKVETHNHPSAIEPYGGAGTGIGGVIRDPLGTGLGAKPILNTDVFCFGPPDLDHADVPQGALHPLRVFKGVVGGVRDYGNRMGIPTANGAIIFDKRFIGNPLVFCGNLALIPRGLTAKRRPATGQVALVVGGRTGRDGIHGATFSSVELDENSETVSSGAVQIGNPIEEKKVTDFLLRARDAGLYSCVTDCGAGGLSSALGEMGEDCGVRVELDKVPLKYEGLTYYEIWISEAQERMVISADEKDLPALQALADEEDVEITVIARFTDDHKLRLNWHGAEVACIDMEFLHKGVPMPRRDAVWNTPNNPEPALPANENYAQTLKALLGHYDICSKEWVIRQYDHEVQGTSVVKPLVGRTNDGPGDAAVITPVLGSTRAIAVSNGIKPRFSDIDPYHMAALAIDEALRNLAAVGAPATKAAILDNFCWGNCNKPQRLGELVRASRACYDIAKAYGTPFISGKDSLNNEFAVGGDVIAIPGTLLISALAVMPDCRKALTMDAKKAGNSIYMLGMTRNELGGSHYYALLGALGSNVPHVDPQTGKKVFAAVYAAAEQGLLRAAHDCSEGGAALALAEMAFAGGLGIDADLGALPTEGDVPEQARLFAESASRLFVEIEPYHAAEAEKIFAACGAPFARVGTVTDTGNLRLRAGEKVLADVPAEELRQAWLESLPKFFA